MMHTDVSPTPAHRGRRFLTWLGVTLGLALGLTLLGTVYESASEAADLRAYPPPGQMVDVGGYRLHINCVGSGSPTVVIDAGLGDWSPMWSRVQAGVATTTRVCTYDRAGMGYSETGPLPRDAQQMARELHSLMERGQIPGPLVLAGHSMGGLPVRVFAQEYPAEVAGIVLIDSMSPGQSKAPAAAPGNAPGKAPAVAAGSPAAAQARIPSFPSLLARIGLVRLFAGPLGMIQDLPPGAKQSFAAITVTPRSVQAWVDEATGMAASFVQADAVKSFGDTPLIVLTAGLGQQPGWDRMQAELLQLSTNSRQLIAERSTHNIELDQPESAIGAIVSMVAQLRQPAVE